MDPSAPFPTTVVAVEALSGEPAMTQLAPAAPTHPPYPEMICSAITALKERDGSSRIAIAKYIDESFSGLPPNHSTLLTHHLKMLKNGGVVVMVKKSYKLRSDNNGDTNTNHVSLPDASGPKRGRGRPPKPKPDTAQPVLASLGLVGESTEKRAQGRPRKSMSLAVVVEQGTDLPKRSPGRPRKYINGGPVVGPLLAKRRPGRPPGQKPKTIADVNKPKSKRRPGRPAKAQSMPLIVPYSTADVPKPRGRPKMVPVAAVNGILKRRGRPPKVGGREVKPKSATGRSPGRPKKNATPPVSEAAVELKKKLEYFQFKVMQIVEVLKPQLSAQSSVSAVTAVQELEGLATLDISAPLPVDAPIQAPVPVPVQQPALQNLEAVW